MLHPHPPRGHLSGCHHLLVTLLLRYRLRNQPRLTCKHVAVQVQRWQVAACKQNPRADRTESSLTLPERPGTHTFLGNQWEGRSVSEPARSPAAGPAPHSPTLARPQGNTGPGGWTTDLTHQTPGPLNHTLGRGSTAAQAALVSAPYSSVSLHGVHGGEQDGPLEMRRDPGSWALKTPALSLGGTNTAVYH